MSTSFTQVFGGTTIYPSDVSYLALALTSDIVLEWPLEATTGNNVVARIIDITPTGPYTIAMPDAMSVGVGQTVLFNNLGPDTITVDNAAGNAILSIGAGEQWQAYLIDNTSVGGVWRTFRYGAAVAQAQAAALAGAGLVADGSELAQNYEVIDFSITPYSLTAPDRARVFVWGGGLGTLNLPTAVAAGDGWFVQVRNGGQGDLTVDPSGTELINAASTLRLQPGDSAVIVSDGVQWYTIGLGQQAVFAFDYTTIAVTGGTYTLSGSELNRIAYKFTGTLASNANIVVPATVQQYWVNNATTGAFTLGVKTASGTATLVAQGETAILYCDGTEIISATTSSPFAGILSVAQGGTGASNAPSALTNLGGTGIGTAVFTASTTAAGRSALAAAASGANSDITSLSGLTTALSVAQGGTGSTTASGARSNLSAAQSGSNADITALTASGGVQVGAPTGGAQGTGTINATGLFINGVGVGTGSGSVTSVAMTVPSFLSVTGSPVTTSGTLAVSLSGTALPVANGGTGQTSYTDGQLLIGNSTGNTLTKATLTAGSGISITNSAGGITITSTAGGGTVTSVAASGGTTGLSFTGSPITTSGTLTLAGTLAIASGGTGATSASGARLNLSAAGSGANSDITSLSGLTTALSIGQGGTGATSAAAALSALGAYPASNPSGFTSNTGTVTSVTGAGTVNGLTLTGTITASGSLTLGGTLSGVSLTTAVTGTLPIANGGTNATTAGGARTALGSTTLGDNLFTITNPSAVTFPRFNADNTVSALDAATFRSAIGAGTSSTTGTVTSVAGAGTVNGLTLTGTVTSSGSLTLGGTLSGVSLTSAVTGTLPIANGGTGSTSTTYCSLSANVTGTLPVGNGGTGATTLTGVLKGNGTSAFTAATAGTDYVAPGGALGTPSSGTLTNCTFPTLNQNTTGSAASLATTNFSIVESGGVLYIKYGATNIAKIDSSGNFTTLANVTAYGTV